MKRPAKDTQASAKTALPPPPTKQELLQWLATYGRACGTGDQALVRLAGAQLGAIVDALYAAKQEEGQP